MLPGVTVNLAGGGLQHPGLDTFGQPQDIDGPHYRRLDGFDRVILVVHRAGGTGQVVDAVHFQENRIDDIVAQKFEIGPAQQIDDVPLMACKEIIKTDDVTARLYQPAAQVGA